VSGLRVDHVAADGALVRFGFADAERAAALGGADVVIGCPRLAGPALEVWHEVAAADAREFALVTIEVDEAAAGGIEAASAEAYRRMLAMVRPSTHPWLLRIWNYVAAINRGGGDDERYRRFCVGRAAAVDAPFNTPPPAATAIGTHGAPAAVQVIALCTRRPGLALENPRQTPAWQYPREYGPVPPGFSRGAIAGDGDALRLVASGTASIVGHVSQHVGDAVAQLHESLANLDALLQEGAARSGRRFTLDDCEALRIYLRDPAQLAAVQAALATTAIGPERVAYLHGDICRAELLVELEGVFAPR
jgi:chorismate lyase/3-hydroxybenzoate synthase